MASPIFCNEIWIYFLLASILSDKPYVNAMMNCLAYVFRSLSGNVLKTKPVRLTNVLMSCLFVSLILVFKVATKSWTHVIVTLPKFSFIKLIKAYPLYFLFCQLELSFILTISLCTSLVISTFGLPSSKLIGLLLLLFYSAASPSNATLGFFWSCDNGLTDLNYPSILFDVF